VTMIEPTRIQVNRHRAVGEEERGR